MIYVEYLVAFCLAVARPELGLIILTFALASVGPAWSQTPVPGLGSLMLSDFAVLGLTVNLICRRRPWHISRYVVWFSIAIWILAMALIHASQAGGLKIIYGLVIRYGLLWLIPIIIVELTSSQRKTLLTGMLACGVLVTGVQAYTYITRDPAFAAKMYYQFQDQPSYKRPETDARYEFSHNSFPRLYPRGALLVQSLMVFLMVRFMLSRRSSWSNWLGIALFCGFGLFFLSLRQRSSAIGLAFALGLFLTYGPAGSRRLSTTLKAITIGAVAVIAVLGYQAATGATFVDDWQKRFESENILDQHNRVHDNWLALNAIWGSPLAGTAAVDVEALALEEGGESLGLDVHPVLAVPVFGGLPLLLLVLAGSWQCTKRCRVILRHSGADEQCTAAAISIVYMFCVALLNFAGIFTLSKDMVPMLLFVGLMESGKQFHRLAAHSDLNPPRHQTVDYRAADFAGATSTAVM